MAYAPEANDVPRHLLADFVETTAELETAIVWTHVHLQNTAPDVPSMTKGLEDLPFNVDNVDNDDDEFREWSLNSLMTRAYSVDWNFAAQGAVRRAEYLIADAERDSSRIYVVKLGARRFSAPTAHRAALVAMAFLRVYDTKGVTDEQVDAFGDFLATIERERLLVFAMLHRLEADFLSGCDRTHNEPQVPADPDAARNEWIYRQVMAGVIYKNIRAALEGKGAELGWSMIGTDQGISDCALRFAVRHGRPIPEPRKQARRKHK